MKYGIKMKLCPWAVIYKIDENEVVIIIPQSIDASKIRMI
jgi:hypothetical protein